MTHLSRFNTSAFRAFAGVMAAQEKPGVGAIIAYAPLNANHRRYKVPAGKADYRWAKAVAADSTS